MNYSHIFRLSLQMTTALATFYFYSSKPAIAGQSNGTTFFNHPPTLQRSAALNSGENNPATYEFTLNVPANAGEPLKAVTIFQKPNLETVDFQVNRSTAFAGSSYGKGAVLPLASIGGPSLPGEAMIVFDPPVQPGQTVTIALPAQRNPAGGVYLFGVTAYPSGKNALGQFLGYGRLHFYPHR
jgi:Protein of unknown function (DUF2808)